MKKKILAIVSALVLVFGLGFFAKTENAYAANDTNKTEVAEKIKELKAAVRKNEIQAAAAKLLMEKNPKAVENFKDELIDLLNKSEALVERAKKAIEIYEQMDSNEDVEEETKYPVDNKEIFEGTVKFFDTEGMIEYQNLDEKLAENFHNNDAFMRTKWAVLEFDKEVEVSAFNSYDDNRRSEKSKMIRLAYFDPKDELTPSKNKDYDYLKQYEGQKIKVRVEKPVWPGDIHLPFGEPVALDFEILE
jgi:hypothetical protein